jgi:hypothetical protein
VTPAEKRFKKVVRELHKEGVYPGPTVINLIVHGHKARNLDGRETRWRREMFKELGIKLLRPEAALPLTDYDGEYRTWYY